MYENSYRRTTKVAARSTIVIGIISILASVFGYLTVPVNSPDLIIFRNAKEAIGNDWLMTIGKIGVFISCIFSFPTLYNGFRPSFFQLFFQSTTFTDIQ